METQRISFDPDDPDFFPEVCARFAKDDPVAYSEIKKALDPYDIIKPGQPCTWNSVSYFHQAWGGELREYNTCLDEPVYDVEDWLTMLCGAEHGAFFMRKFSSLDGWFMSGMASGIFLWWMTDDGLPKLDSKRRWVGTIIGLRALAIHLCSRRHRRGMDYKRIGAHADYIARTAVLITHMKYNDPLRAAVKEFMSGQHLSIWETTVNSLTFDDDSVQQDDVQ